MNKSILKKQDDELELLNKWLLEHGFQDRPDSGRCIKDDKMWQDLHYIICRLQDNNRDIKLFADRLPNNVIRQVAKEILVPYKINLDHIVHTQVDEYL